MPYTPSAIGGVAADRFGVKKNTGWLWIASAGLTDTTNFVPTEDEINSTTNARDLTCAVAGFTGFTGSPRYAELADLCADVDGKVPDGVSLDDSSLSFFLARSGTDALAYFTEEDLGYIYHAPYGRFDDGSAAATRAYGWKAEVSFVTPTPAMAGGAMGVVSYGILDRRVVTLPAATT